MSIILIFICLATSLAKSKSEVAIKSPNLLDLILKDYTFKSYQQPHSKTGKPHFVNLPSNLSGITVQTVRFRCGSLTRYGTQFNQFHLEKGINIKPCFTRVILIQQNLGSNFSSTYYQNYDLSGYQLISPVLGLLAYNADNITSIPSQIEIQAVTNPITIDFSNMSSLKMTPSVIPLCVTFELDGKVTLSNQLRPNVCVAKREGHFALVIESNMIPLKRKMSTLKIAISSTIGAVLGIFLLSLLVIAMFVNAKKKARIDQLERMAYEEEALQVSMVGHVRALTALGTRTVPTNIEHDESRYRPH